MVGNTCKAVQSFVEPLGSELALWSIERAEPALGQGGGAGLTFCSAATQRLPTDHGARARCD